MTQFSSRFTSKTTTVRRRRDKFCTVSAFLRHSPQHQEKFAAPLFRCHHNHQHICSRSSASSHSAIAANEGKKEGRKSRGNKNKLPTRLVVETAMLAAMSSLFFHLSASFRLETYLGSLFPLPIVIASARWGDVAAWRTLLVAFLLLNLLSGPLRASNYGCLHGFTGLALGLCWKRKLSWVYSVPISAFARTVGVFSSLMISSLMIRENVFRLMVVQVYALIDQICATLGATFVPNLTAILCMAFFFVILNSLSYTLILHLVYSIALTTATPDGNFANAPARVRRVLGLPPVIS